jgi:hypothetical protein
MPFLSFMEALKMLEAGIKSDFNDNMTLQAFNAWQILEALKVMLGGDTKGAQSFQEYARKLGLIEDKEPTKQETDLIKHTRKLEKERALETANKILQLHREGRARKNG